MGKKGIKKQSKEGNGFFPKKNVSRQGIERDLSLPGEQKEPSLVSKLQTLYRSYSSSEITPERIRRAMNPEL